MGAFISGCACWLVGLVFLSTSAGALGEPVGRPPEGFPETPEIDAILAGEHAPDGVLFNVMEYDEDALEWVSVRLLHYIERLRDGFSDLSIVVVSHGDEMFALTSDEEELYPEVHERIRWLVDEQGVVVHVCGATAAANGVDPSAFPYYVDVVPSASTQIRDYREFGFKVITMELTW